MTFLLLLLVQLQHGVQLVGEVRQHGAYVLQHVTRRPFLRGSLIFLMLLVSLRQDDMRVGSHPDSSSVVVGKGQP